MKAQEILNLINKQWATKTDIAKIGQCGKDKAGKIKKIIEEELGDSFFLPKRSPQNPPEYPSNKRKIITYFMGKCQKKWIKQFGWIFCPKRQFAFHIYVFIFGNGCQLWSNR